MNSNSSYRIRTNINQDKVVRVQLKQDVDMFEILSLSFSQSDVYNLHTSNYGVIVGRVLANQAFGIPNAKVSVFVPMDEDDRVNSNILNNYPYNSVMDKNPLDRKRYNLLPTTSKGICHQAVGSFPNKETLLDNDVQIEIFEKYYKYTTVTNKSGDYMLFGVPCGSQTVHVDIDLSDIGVLSQKPRDMLYKGYSITEFENSNQFKNSTNLNDLAQIKSQDTAIHVYPFWGDADDGEIAISRCDVEINYEFEPTCVFMGSLVTDNFSNSIGHGCSPSNKSGFNSKFIAGEGTIEMIRKTPDNLVEEFQILGNRQIDGDGVWCYQIPMNLDYVGTDEFGNIVATDNPKKGIPTRTRVRFRISVQETGNEGVSRHRAKYLVPNLVPLDENEETPTIKSKKLYENWYEYGSNTKDEYFRDLFWNKIYSVKSYIPRIQNGKGKNTQNYNCIRSVNVGDSFNPLPFNSMRIRLGFVYIFLCSLITTVSLIVSGLNALISAIGAFLNFFCTKACVKVWKWKICPLCPLVSPIRALVPPCIKFDIGLDTDSDGLCYTPGCINDWARYKKPDGCRTTNSSLKEMLDNVQTALAQEFDIMNLDFSNDWINGVLYFPLWFWKKTKKQKFFFGLFSKKAHNTYCNCDNKYNKLNLTKSCALDKWTDTKKGKYHTDFENIKIKQGVIKEHLIPQQNSSEDLKVYYYSPCNIIDDSNANKIKCAVLYATDIILLGSFNDCDIDNLPRFFEKLPTTTANIPNVAPIIVNDVDDKSNNEGDGLNDESLERGTIEFSGMDVMRGWDDTNKQKGFLSRKGLFFDLTCYGADTFVKSCVNVGRLSELGVSLDSTYKTAVPSSDGYKMETVYADGMITKYELDDAEGRSMFASMNHNGLRDMVINPHTGYKTYNLKYLYLSDFDGNLSSFASWATKSATQKTKDYADKAYLKFREGRDSYGWLSIDKRHQYADTFTLYNNSFYFYFGLKEGSTAIDKFNEKYNAKCIHNEKSYISYDIKTTPTDWCYDEGNPNTFGSIKVILNRIAKPYSYILTDSTDTVILNEDGLYLEELLWEGTYFTYQGETNPRDHLILNGDYKLMLTDANKNKMQIPIKLYGLSVNASIDSTALGDKWYGDSSNRDDFCSRGVYGTLKLSGFSFDGASVELTACYVVQQNDIGKYRLTFTSTVTFKTYEAYLYIIPMELNDYGNMYAWSECACGNASPSFANIITTDGVKSVVFNIWIPGDYEVKIVQICDGNENDNVFDSIETIPNGKPFTVFLNNVPTKFLLGEAQNNQVFLNTSTSVDESWLKLRDKSLYRFAPSEVRKLRVWSDFVPISLDEEDTNKFDESTLRAILKYQLSSISNTCVGAYVTENSTASWSISSIGGAQPPVYRSIYPAYSMDNDNIRTDNQLDSVIHDNLGYVSSNENLPTIIGNNYTYKKTKDDKIIYHHPTANTLVEFNNLFKNRGKLGNYFAASTKQDGSASVIKVPSNATFTTSNTYEIKDDYHSVVQNYIRTQFVDSRLDYVFFIKAPLNNKSNDFDIGYTGNTLWKDGFISGSTINGIQMSYDDDYNILSKKNDELEYSYDNDYELNWNNPKDQRYYSANLTYSNGTSEDIRDQLKGSISTMKYPYWHKIDKLKIQPTSTLKYEVVSCGYNYDISDSDDVEDGEMFGDIICTVGEDGRNSFEISFADNVKFVQNNNDNIEPNLLYEKKGDYFKCTNLKVRIRLSPDNTDTNHTVINYTPFLTEVTNTYRNNPNSNVSSNVLNTIFSSSNILNALKNNSTTLSLDGDSVEDIKLEKISNIGKYKEYTHFFESVKDFQTLITKEDKEIVDASWDDAQNAIWYSKNVKPSEKNHDIYCLVTLRHYFNNEENRLSQELLVVNTSKMIDCRLVELTPKGTYFRLIEDAVTVNVEVPNEDGEGTHIEKEETSPAVYQQHLIFGYKIPTESNPRNGCNHQMFTSVDDNLNISGFVYKKIIGKYINLGSIAYDGVYGDFNPMGNSKTSTDTIYFGIHLPQKVSFDPSTTNGSRTTTSTAYWTSYTYLSRSSGSNEFRIELYITDKNGFLNKFRFDVKQNGLNNFKILEA